MWKIFTNAPSSLTFCPLLKTTFPDWTNYSWQGFNSLVCPLMLKTNYRCVQSTQHQCGRRQMCGKWSHINSLHSLLDCYKKRLVITEQSIHGKVFNSWGCPLMLRTNYRWVSVSINISVDVAKCEENVHKFTQFTHFLSVTKKRLVLIEQSIDGKVSTH